MNPISHSFFQVRSLLLFSFLAIIILQGAVLAGTEVDCVNMTGPLLPAILWGPYLTGTTDTTITVNIKTDIVSPATVEYATDAYYRANAGYDRITTDYVITELHHITLSGLSPGTLYHYRVSCNGTISGDLHFHTFFEEGPITFVVYGDTQDQLPTFSQLGRHRLVADRIAEEEDVLFVLNTGDLTNDGANLSDWDRYFAAGRTMMANTTVYPALGNHDANNSNYYEAYGVPEWYSFECGEVHMTVLDSTSDGWARMPEQSAWLQADLAGAAGADWKFVSFHNPPFTSELNHFGGYENVRSEWEDDLNEYQVDGVFNGHVHAYERFLINNTSFFVIGTGGGPAYNLNTPRATGSLGSLEYALAYIRVTVDPDCGTATFQLIRVADVSGDLKNITMIYPPDTVFDTVILKQKQKSLVTGGVSTSNIWSGTALFSVRCLDRSDKNVTTWAWIFGAQHLVNCLWT